MMWRPCSIEHCTCCLPLPVGVAPLDEFIRCLWLRQLSASCKNDPPSLSTVTSILWSLNCSWYSRPSQKSQIALICLSNHSRQHSVVHSGSVSIKPSFSSSDSSCSIMFASSVGRVLLLPEAVVDTFRLQEWVKPEGCCPIVLHFKIESGWYGSHRLDKMFAKKWLVTKYGHVQTESG